MNELKVNGTQRFMGIDIPIIEGGFGKDQKVILAKTIAEIHNQPLKKINQLIKDNIEEFEIGVDLLDLKIIDNINQLLQIGYSKQSISNSKHIYCLSEKGYIKYFSLIRNKNDNIFKDVVTKYFKNNNENVYGFIQNKEIRFRNQLSTILNKFNVKCLFQYIVQQYRIDIYLPEFNIAIEYDENKHKYYTYEEQELREQNIKDVLGCKFIRVTDEYSIDEAVSIVLKEIFEIKKELII